MSGIISFLEELGRRSDLKIDGLNIEALMENEDFDPDVRKAILNKDQKALEMMLDARSKIVCLIAPAKEDDDEDEDDDNDNQNDEDENDDEKSSALLGNNIQNYG